MNVAKAGPIYTNSGDDKFAYWNEDGSFYVANEFDQKHMSANLVGRFECYWYGLENAKNKKCYGFWRSERTGLGEAGERIYFEENDTMDLIFQGELTHSLKSVQSKARNFKKFWRTKRQTIVLEYKKTTKILKDMDRIKQINQDLIKANHWSIETKNDEK